MPQAEKATGIVPATWSAVPARRPDPVKVTGRETPFSSRRPAAVTLIVAPVVKAGPSVTGRVSVNVASGYRPVCRLLTTCGAGLPLTLTVVRSTAKTALVSRPPDTVRVPVTADVRPNVSLLKPSTVSLTRKPAAEPAATCHWPSSGPAARRGGRRAGPVPPGWAEA